jgi:hypothetical protein
MLLATQTVAPFSYAAGTGPVFYGDPPDDRHPWAVHDRNRPQPKLVTPGAFSVPDRPGQPPSDAIILFDGTDLSKWEGDKGAAPKWIVTNGVMQVTPSSGEIRTKEKFGDCQLHVEWATPTKIEGESQGRGNSGVFLMGRLEIQVLDNYNNPTYSDGTAGAYYGVNPPLAKAVRPPGEFQAYDIVFRRPIYKDGQPIDPGYVTVFLNGVLVQDHTPIEGPGGHMGRSKPGPFPDKGPLALQDHGNPMRFRNIWYRELPPRACEGGTDGALSPAAALAKRKETAAGLRAEAATAANPANPLPQLRLWLESLVYESDAATQQQAEQLGRKYIDGLRALPATALAAKKDEAKDLNGAFRYLIRFNRLPAGFAPAADLDQMIKDQGWDKKR